MRWTDPKTGVEIDVEISWWQPHGPYERAEFMGASLTLVPGTGTRLSASAIRRIHWDSLIDRSRQEELGSHLAGIADGTLSEGDREFLEEGAAQWQPRGASAVTATGAKGRYPADHLTAVAAYYVAQVRAGSKAPTQAVADRWGVSRAAAAQWVRRARRAPGADGRPLLRAWGGYS